MKITLKNYNVKIFDRLELGQHFKILPEDFHFFRDIAIESLETEEDLIYVNPCDSFGMPTSNNHFDKVYQFGDGARLVSCLAFGGKPFYYFSRYPDKIREKIEAKKIKYGIIFAEEDTIKK